MPATISLAKGSTDANSAGAVSQLQQLLTQAGFPVAVTGVFDVATDTALRAYQQAKGLGVDGVAGTETWKSFGFVSKSYPPYYAKYAAFGRQVLEAAWESVTGEPPTLAQLQIAGAQAHLESLYGRSEYKLLDHTTGNTIATSGVINNWGAVQTSEGPPKGVLVTDTSPLKKTATNPKGYYDHYYKVYATPEEGARHFIEHMTIKRPTSWALMKTGDIDAWAEAMHAGYDSQGKLKKDPISGMPGYFEQSPPQRAKGIEERVWAIADTLGEPIAATRGGPPPIGVDDIPVGDVFLPGGEYFPGAVKGAKAGGLVVFLGGLAIVAWKLATGRWPW